MNSASSVKNGIEMASDGSIDVLKFFIDKAVVPVVAVIILAFTIFFIVGAVKKHRSGDDYHQDVTNIIVCVVGIALVLSFPAWGWAMIGMGSSSDKESGDKTSSGTSVSIQYDEGANAWEKVLEELPIKV